VRFIKAAQRIGFSLDKVADLVRLETALADMVGRCAADAGQVSCTLIATLHEAA
jgi:MerR, DNA binding